MNGVQADTLAPALAGASGVRVELEVEIPGGPHATYRAAGADDTLHLTAVAYPAERYPADLCAVTNTLAADGQAQPLAALLLGNVSHPAGCRIEARLLGVFCVGAEPEMQPYLIAVAAGDPHFSQVGEADALAPLRRQGLEVFVRLTVSPSAEISWGSSEAAHALVQAGRQRYRLARAAAHDAGPIEPAWKPSGLSDGMSADARAEARRHTAAEHGFHRLPYRFQHYVEASLTPDERILLSVPRPLMHSRLKRNALFGLRRRRLEEGVLVVTDRQVAQVTELMPPDSAGIRYGFIDRVSAPERLADIRLVDLSPAAVGLALSCTAAGGQEQILWEFPANQKHALEAAVQLLTGWLPQPGERRLQRATPPAPPETWPPLRDPAGNDPADVLPVAERLEASLTAALCPGERALARCLLPAWVGDCGRARLVAVTTKRFLVLPDSGPAPNEQPEIALPISAISSLEFSSTLVGSHLKLLVPKDGRVEARTIRFTATVAAMDNCYHTLRRVMGVVTVHDPHEEHG